MIPQNAEHREAQALADLEADYLKACEEERGRSIGWLAWIFAAGIDIGFFIGLAVSHKL